MVTRAYLERVMNLKFTIIVYRSIDRRSWKMLRGYGGHLIEVERRIFDDAASSGMTGELTAEIESSSASME
jgi:cysteine synthase